MLTSRVLIILALGSILSSCGGGSDSSPAVSPPPPNQAPTANAGADHNVDEGATVELSGLGADSDGTVVSYSWQQTSGPALEALENHKSSEALKQFMAKQDAKRGRKVKNKKRTTKK